MLVTSLFVGDQRLHQLADQLGRTVPKNLGLATGVAAIVFLGLWLFLSNVMLLVGYTISLEP